MSTHRLSRAALAAASIVLIGAGATACAADSGSDSERVDVVTAFYPVQLLAERVGGDAVNVVNLAQPGVDPHALELTPRQIGQMSDAELVVYLKGFQPAVDDAVAQLGDDRRTFDVADGEPLRHAGGHRHDDADGHGDDKTPDPHFWLDPTRLAAVGDRLADRLGELDPEHADDYAARAGAFRAELENLDQEYQAGLAACQRREIVVSHAAFGYLTDRYRLEQIAVAGLTPDDEPSHQRLAEVIEEAKAHQATTIFFEALVSPKVAETIAREIGVRTAVLDPLEGKPEEGDYFTVMRTNLTTLRAALGCS